MWESDSVKKCCAHFYYSILMKKIMELLFSLIFIIFLNFIFELYISNMREFHYEVQCTSSHIFPLTLSLLPPYSFFKHGKHKVEKHTQIGRETHTSYVNHCWRKWVMVRLEKIQDKVLMLSDIFWRAQVLKSGFNSI